MVGNKDDYRRNSYGYSDPTAYSLISKENTEESERFHALLYALRAGFEFDEHHTLADKRTGRVWR